MVVIHVKFGGEASDEFLYETSCSASCDALIRELVEMNNTRVRLAFLCGAVKELGRFGPAKPAEEQGNLDEVKEQLEGMRIDKSANYEADPSGARVGNGVGPQLTAVFEEVAAEAERYISKNQVKARKALTMEALKDKVANFRGAVAMAFPMGLPKHDVVFAALESTDGLEGTQADRALLNPDTAQLWCAGREFQRNQTVGDRLGKNEKTKVVAKLVNPGSGPPGREPIVNDEERKAMMAHYFKRQQDLKDLSESTDDDYLTSQWANPKGLKNSLQGFDRHQIIAPGLGRR